MGVIDDVIYFKWWRWKGCAHNTTNTTCGQTSQNLSIIRGEYMAIVVGDTIYFDADDGTLEENCGHKLEQTYWQVSNRFGFNQEKMGSFRYTLFQCLDHLLVAQHLEWPERKDSIPLALTHISD